MSVTEINKTSATVWPLWQTVGRLELNQPVTLDEICDPLMMHDPTKLKAGIAISPNDQIMAARRVAYLVSAANRSGGWQACSLAKLYDNE